MSEVLILNGSGRGKKSTSAGLGIYLVNLLKEENIDANMLTIRNHLNSKEKTKIMIDAISVAAHIIIIAPLYDDCQPYNVVKAQEIIAESRISSYGDYTYVANRSSLIILRHFESAGDTYVPGNVLAQSTKLSTASGITITDATLTVDMWHHSLCSYEFYLSADGGNHWEAVDPNVLHAFSNTGEDLRWRVFLTGLRDRSDHIHSVTINYNYDTIPVVSEYSFLIISSGYTILFIIISVAALSVFKKKKKSLKNRLV